MEKAISKLTIPNNSGPIVFYNINYRKQWGRTNHPSYIYHFNRKAMFKYHILLSESVQCIPVQCILYRYTLYSVHCTVYTVQCIPVQCILYSVYLYSVYCTGIHCTVYTVQVYTVQCTLYSVYLYSVPHFLHALPR